MSGKICPYFVHGVCKFGDKCRNLHDFSAPSDDVCRYYLIGACSYGSRCRYKHVRPDKKHSSKAAAQQKGTNLVPKVNVVSSTTVGSAVTFEGADDDLCPKLASINLSEETAKTSNKVDDSCHKSFAEVLRGPESKSDQKSTPCLCPFFEKCGICPLGSDCPYIHGEMCDICNMFSLHPQDENQRRQHLERCTAQVEEDMNQAFAYQLSQDKICLICLEHVVKKAGIEARFGILENCNHVFCLDCIRKWRASEGFENKVIKACPACRTTSDFVTPSVYWYENEEHKKQIIENYKKSLNDIDCKYFDFGNGQCPFADRCFYRHCYRDGSKAILGEPTVRRLLNASGELSVISNPTLYSFLEARDTAAETWLNMNDPSTLLDYLREAELVSLDSTLMR